MQFHIIFYHLNIPQLMNTRLQILSALGLFRRRFSKLSSLVILITIHRCSTIRFFFPKRKECDHRSIFVRNLSKTTNDSSKMSSKCEFEYPLKWESILNIINTNRLHCLRRSEEQQEIYMQYLEDMKKHWVHPLDHVLHTKFQFAKVLSSSVNNSSTLYEAFPKICHETRIQLCRNDYPYNFENNIQHWVLWKLSKEPITPKEIHDAKQQLHTNQASVIATAHWVNPPHLKSLPEIDHVHIVCLLSTSSDL